MDSPLTQKTKQQSQRLVSVGEMAPKKTKMGLSANKVMATGFWSARSRIHIDYLQKVIANNDEYFAISLNRFNDNFMKK